MQRHHLAVLLAALIGAFALAPAGASAASAEEVAEAVHSAAGWIRGQQDADTGALDISPSTVGGTLSVTTDGTLTESGAITAAAIERPTSKPRNG